NNYESDRNVDIPGFSRTANGRTSGSQYVLNLDGGYDHPVAKDLTVGPFAGLQYVHMDVNSFTENGAGAANLALNDQAMDSLRSRLGVRLELRKEITPSWVAASEVRVAWMHEFANNDRAIVARFSGSGLGSFAVRTDDPERNAALIGLGFNVTYRDMLTTFVDYDVQAGQSHYTEQIVKGGFKWSF
ncbi:MAG: autotransporter outer membrane beta-barrel domain-containing protein, partial [Chthoniobacteraceae bacterium]|nr:autotransporter outer membrane beta-barrel domain-containing protein [Chthoniobacteraceae bacterium]